MFHLFFFVLYEKTRVFRARLCPIPLMSGSENTGRFMKLLHSQKIFAILLCLAAILVLAGCNMPNQEVESSGLDVTQAYQTVEAQLTQAVAQTPVLTSSPELPNPAEPDEPEELTPLPATVAPAEPEEPTLSPTPETRCDQAAAAYPKIDITIEDDTKMVPGQGFTKTWRVVNVGTCTWTLNYEVVWFSGEQLAVSGSFPLDMSAAPNQSIDISVDMTAPAEPGTYQSNWKLRNPGGDLFGIGPIGESPFWVRIEVVEIATATPTPTPTATATTVVQASGPVTLVISDTLDLDNLLINSGSADLMYQSTGGDPPQHQLVPLGSVLLGIFSDVQPALAECQAASMGAVPLTVENLASGTYVCYRTDLGLPGWARFDVLNPDDGTLGLEILTWSLP